MCGLCLSQKTLHRPLDPKAKKQGPKSQGTNPQISDESQTPRASLNPLVSWLRCALSAFSTYCTSTTAGARHEWFRSQALPGRLFWRLATTSDEKSGLRFEVDLGTGPLGLGPLRPRYAVHSASNTCNRVHPKGQLGSSTPPTHNKRSRLWLLPSGPDQVRGRTLWRTQPFGITPQGGLSRDKRSSAEHSVPL